MDLLWKNCALDNLICALKSILNYNILIVISTPANNFKTLPTVHSNQGIQARVYLPHFHWWVGGGVLEVFTHNAGDRHAKIAYKLQLQIYKKTIAAVLSVSHNIVFANYEKSRLTDAKLLLPRE